ncbi:hypothetical protein HII31_04645 [Pseudocercospora fuligena]|uniref:Uncharacterized protein n=1 Tax=Pseudocercospora fuligena TaxID=685502 RepID=A0A8H6VIR4_9PEZI|nr:hypothetical protein HII31_04645 [Pseudocercospora fuligena]
MRFNQVPRPLLHLLTTILLAPPSTLAFPDPIPAKLAGFSLNELFGRQACAGTTCGYYGQLCCGSGQGCYTDAASIVSCTANGGTQATAAGGYYSLYTTTYVQTDLVTVTSVMSTYIGGAAATGISCGANQQSCGTICCASNQYCFSQEQSQCKEAAGGGSSGYPSGYPTAAGGGGATAGAPVRPTSSAYQTITTTASPTTTVPFMSPVATGANVTVTGSEQDNGGGGLSGGAIAGIVIGVLAGLLLLGLLCFYCCLKGLLDGCLACFGLGGRRRRREVVEEERYSHHSHHGGAGGGRTWYGASRPPARVDRRDKKSHDGRNLLGVGAGLAALWAVLGLKRKRDNRRRNDEKYSEYSYSSDYYTSASSASSDDRRTHGTRYSRR